MYEVSAEGPLFSLSGGEARLAAGAGYRATSYEHFNRLTDAAVAQGDDSVRYAYAEINLPLLGPESSVAGIQRLTLTGAVRREDYNSFGGVTTPKAGIVFAPTSDFTLRTSWGKSFKAPTLHERHSILYATVDPSSYWGGTSYPDGLTVLANSGGNRNLGPERARTWTASVAFHPEATPNLDMELTWFDIDYTSRVTQPVPVWFEALVNPIYAPFVVYDPTEQQQADLIAAADQFLNYTDQPYDPSDVVAIVYAQRVNAARQDISGIDLTGSYWFDLGAGRGAPCS